MDRGLRNFVMLKSRGNRSEIEALEREMAEAESAAQRYKLGTTCTECGKIRGPPPVSWKFECLLCYADHYADEVAKM